jgi:raffinose/stachyose/melibiose transport system substrate-binding protein
VGDDNLGMLPIYIGVDGEQEQGLCTGSENYWCVNKNASEEDIQATLDFINWCVTSEEGTSALADDMGFVCPFKAAKETTNPLVKIANEYVTAGKTPVDWCFSTMPSENWKNDVGSALTAYAAGTGDWDGVVKTAFVDGWASEYQSWPTADRRAAQTNFPRKWGSASSPIPSPQSAGAAGPFPGSLRC